MSDLKLSRSMNFSFPSSTIEVNRFSVVLEINGNDQHYSRYSNIEEKEM